MKNFFRRLLSSTLLVLVTGVGIFGEWSASHKYLVQVPTAEAANTPGNYMIRRNDNETDSVTTSNLDTTWDTLVDSKGTSISYSAGTFTLASGKYLVLYSERFDTTDITNNRRVEIQSRLVVGGTEDVIGSGQTYIRKEDGSAGDWHRASILGGAAILDIPSDSTSLVTRFYRTDSSSDAGGTVDRTPDWGGITIIALDDTWDYARYSRNTTVNVPDAFADVVWETQDEQDTGFSQTNGDITITTAGRYLVTYSIPMSISSGTDRSEVVSRITLDGSVVEGTHVSTYMRGNESTQDGVLSYVGIIDVAANDVLSVESDIIDGTSTFTMNANANVQILELPSGAETFIVNATTGEMNPATLTEFAWDTTPHLDAAAFTDTSATDSIVEVDVFDDYLFFATQQTTNGNVRTFPSARFSVNDTISNYAAAGQYNRSAGADQAGYSFGTLITDVPANADISLENIFIEVDQATQTLNHGAMSGLRWGSIFTDSDPDTHQIHFRWRDDTTALNTSGGFLAAEDSNAIGNAQKNTTYRLRIESANTGGAAESGARTYELEYGLRDTTCDAISTWTGVADSSDAFDMAATTHINPDGQATTALLSNGEGYTFVAGEGRESADTTGSIGALSSDNYTEVEYSFQPTSSATSGATYCFRLYDATAGSTLDAYDVYPEITIAAPTTEQLHYRWRDDTTALNTTGGFLAAEDTAITGVVKGDTYRLRIEAANTGDGPEESARTYELEYALKDTTCSAVSSWTGVADATDEFDMVDSTHITSDGQATTALLANTETYTFVAGEGRDLTDTTGSIGPMAASRYTELEYSFRAANSTITGQTYCFRLYDATAGAPLDNYDVYPEATIASTPITVNENILEWGTQASVGDDGWTTITFEGTYSDPVFVCSAEYNNNIGSESDGDADAVVCRVQNVTSTSAQVRLQEPGTEVGQTGNLLDETVHWIVAEAGDYDTGDLKMEAFHYTSTVTDGKTPVGWNGEQQTLTQTYTNPVVLGQVMTTNDNKFSGFWAHNGSNGAPTSSLIYTGKHISEDVDLTRDDEEVGVIVIEQANDTIDGVTYEARLQTQTIDRIDDSTTQGYNFNTAFSSTPEVAIISLAGVSGTDGPYPTLYGSSILSTTRIDLAVMETEIVDVEQTGNTEFVPYIVFESAGSYQQTGSASLDQTNFRFYQNADNVQPGTALDAENTAPVDVSDGDIIRLRTSLQSGDGLDPGATQFKLQYGEGADCSAIVSWTDVGAIGSGVIWRGNTDNTIPSDGDPLSSSLLNSQANPLQSYEEANNSVDSLNAVHPGEYGEWDWVLENNGAYGGTEYCFRMTKDNGAIIQYGVYPQLTTEETTFTQNTYRWYVDNDATNPTEVWGEVDIAEDTEIQAIPPDDPPNPFQELRLRLNMTVNTADLNNDKKQFKLQYKAGTDNNCTTGSWTDVGAAQTWEYAASSVTDGVTVTNVLSTSDVAGQYAKSSATTANVNTATTGQDIEYDFHIIGTNLTGATKYSFRVVEDDDTVLDGYTNCPTLRAEPGMDQLLRGGSFFVPDEPVNDGIQLHFWAD